MKLFFFFKCPYDHFEPDYLLPEVGLWDDFSELNSTWNDFLYDICDTADTFIDYFDDHCYNSTMENITDSDTCYSFCYEDHFDCFAAHFDGLTCNVELCQVEFNYHYNDIDLYEDDYSSCGEEQFHFNISSYEEACTLSCEARSTCIVSGTFGNGTCYHDTLDGERKLLKYAKEDYCHLSCFQEPECCHAFFNELDDCIHETRVLFFSLL